MRMRGSILQIVQERYAEIDPQVTKQLREHVATSTCKQGCAACCRLLTLIHGSEGHALAMHVLQTWPEGEITGLLQRLRSDALRMHHPKVGNRWWMTQRRPCAFLVDERCSVYAMRPAVCRYYYSFSDPALCSTPDTRPNTYDMSSAIEAMTDMEAGLQLQGFGDGESAPSPIPIAVLWGMRSLRHAIDLSAAASSLGVAKAIEVACEGILSPAEWFDAYGEQITNEVNATPRVIVHLDDNGQPL